MVDPTPTPPVNDEATRPPADQHAPALHPDPSRHLLDLVQRQREELSTYLGGPVSRRMIRLAERAGVLTYSVDDDDLVDRLEHDHDLEDIHDRLRHELARARHFDREAARQAAQLIELRQSRVAQWGVRVDRWLSTSLDAARAVTHQARRSAQQHSRDARGLRAKRDITRRSSQLDASLVEDASKLGASATSATSAAITVVVLGDGPPRLHLPSRSADIEVISLHAPTVAEVANALCNARGEVICILSRSCELPQPDWLTKLVAPLEDDEVVAVAAEVVNARHERRRSTPDDLLVAHTGFDAGLRGDEPTLIPAQRGSPALIESRHRRVLAVSPQCCALRREALVEVGGLDTERFDDLSAAFVDLCVRLGRHGGRIIGTRSIIALDHHDGCDEDTPVLSRSAWSAIVDDHGPYLARLGTPLSGARARIALSVGAPNARLGERWGDWHFATGLAQALRRRGVPVRVQALDEVDDLPSRSADVHIVLRGKHPVRRTDGQQHIVWIISHPEAVGDAECDAADLVLVASHRFADHLRQRTASPVEVLLQATDHRRFRPLGPVARYSHPVAVVANARHVMRPIVKDAIDAGLEPAIYGSGWRGLIDEHLLVAERVPNDVLPSLYSSVGVLLGDHWATMRAWGFVSNRLFDALACGTPIVSDAMDEIPELFADAVSCYHDVGELSELVHRVLGDPRSARTRALRGRRVVLAQHTFDHRAADLLRLAGLGGHTSDPV